MEIFHNRGTVKGISYGRVLGGRVQPSLQITIPAYKDRKKIATSLSIGGETDFIKVYTRLVMMIAEHYELDDATVQIMIERHELFLRVNNLTLEEVIPEPYYKAVEIPL